METMAIPMRMAQWFLLFLILVLSESGLTAETESDPALTRFHSANSMTMRRLYKLAIPQYREFLTEYPKHEKAPQARWGLALCLHATEAYQEAADLLAGLEGSAAIADQEQLHNVWGRCLLALGEPEKAEKTFLWTIEKGGNATRKGDALACLLETLDRRKKYAELVRRADELLAVPEAAKHAQLALYYSGVAQLALKAYEPAEKMLLKLTGSGQDGELVHRAYYQLGECYERSGKLKEAAAQYQIAASQKKGSYTPASQYKLGVARILSGETQQGMRDLSEFLKNHGDSPLAPYARLYVGRGLMSSKNHRDAQTRLSELLNTEPVAAEARLWLARACARDGKHKEAAELLQDASAKHGNSPFLPELLYESGLAEMQLEQFGAAAGRFALIPEESGELSIEAQRMRAFCLHRDGKLEESVKLCDAFLARNPNHAKAPEVLFLKAEGLQRLGRVDEAQALFAKVRDAQVSDDHRGLSRLRLAKEAYDEKKYAACMEQLTPLLDLKDPGPAFAQVHFMAGDSLLRKEEWAGAATHLERFIREQPKEANVDTAMFNLALAYQKTGRMPEATRLLQTLAKSVNGQGKGKGKDVALKPSNPDAYADFCRLVYEHENDEKRKVAFLEQAAREHVPEAHYYLAWVHVAAKRDAEAIQQFGEVLRHPEHELAFDAGLQRSILQIRAEGFKDAFQTLSQLATKFPNHAKYSEVLFYRGMCLARQGEFEKAIADFAAVMEQHPDAAVADRTVYWHAWSERRRGKPDEAERLLDLFTSRYPKSPYVGEAKFERAELDLEKKRYDQAIANLEPLASDQAWMGADRDRASRVLYLLGWCHQRAGHGDASAKAFDGMLRLGGNKDRAATAAFQAGEARLTSRDYRGALADFQKAEELSRGTKAHPPSLLRLAQCLDLNGKWAECLQTAERFLAAYPESELAPQAHYCRGWSLENQKRYDDARQAYEAVLAAGKRDEVAAKAQFQMGECCFSQGKYDEALTHFTYVETRYRLDAYTGKALVEMGRTLEKQEKWPGAAERYQEVLRRFPDSTAAAAAKELLARVTERMKREKR